MGLNDAPQSVRLHIGLFGLCNSGKTSLLNAITGQQVGVVSDTAGTTTDPIYKAMEIPGIGAAMLIDTAGFDDRSELGMLRVVKTKEAASAVDIAILLFTGEDIVQEFAWLEKLKQTKAKVIPVISKMDMRPNEGKDLAAALQAQGLTALRVSARTREGIGHLLGEITRVLPEDFDAITLTGNLCQSGDTILLVMPQDIQAPKGRLILPQVQTMRELLDKGCTFMSCRAKEMKEALAKMAMPPDLIITDSQVFSHVYAQKPPTSRLTSFSMLFARYKGDIEYFLAGGRKLTQLAPRSRILIAEACTHRPLEEDIGRVKLPRLLKRRLGLEIKIEIVSGRDFPLDLSPYDMIIHCGGCMFNRRYVLNRVAAAKAAKVPMTNYGVAIAALLDILAETDLPTGDT